MLGVSLHPIYRMFIVYEGIKIMIISVLSLIIFIQQTMYKHYYSANQVFLKKFAVKMKVDYFLEKKNSKGFKISPCNVSKRGEKKFPAFAM